MNWLQSLLAVKFDRGISKRLAAAMPRTICKIRLGMRNALEAAWQRARSLQVRHRNDHCLPLDKSGFTSLKPQDQFCEACVSTK